MSPFLASCVRYPKVTKMEAQDRLLGKIEPPPPPQLLEALTLDEFLEVQRRLEIIEQQVRLYFPFIYFQPHRFVLLSLQ